MRIYIRFLERSLLPVKPALVGLEPLEVADGLDAELHGGVIVAHDELRGAHARIDGGDDK